MASLEEKSQEKLLEAHYYFLDEIYWIVRNAVHCPLGFSDPDQPESYWAYMLSSDPGCPTSYRWIRQYTQWTHDNFIVLWYHTPSRILAKFYWKISWFQDTGWTTHWYRRLFQDRWQSYPSDVILDRLIQPENCLRDWFKP